MYSEKVISILTKDKGGGIFLKKIITILLALMLFLTGCQSHSTIQGVEEPTTDHPDMYDENETWAENDERLCLYLPDKYFYDTDGELDFYETLGSKMHIKVNDCYTVSSLQEAGSYFSTDTIKNWYREQKIFDSDSTSTSEFTWLMVNATITCLAEQEITFCIFDISFKARAYDDSMVKFGVNNKKILENITSELCYDYGNRKYGKDYYMIQMKPGESFTTNILYCVYKDSLAKDKEIYLGLGGHHIGAYDPELGRIMPIEDDPKIRFLRIYPRVTD